MTDTKKQDLVNPIAAAVTGAAIGAGVAIAGAIALKDEKNRKKVKDVLSNLKDRGEEMQKDLNKEASDTKNEVKAKVDDAKKDAEDKKPRELTS